MTSISFDGVHVNLTIRRPGGGVLVVVLRGLDAGELGDQPFVELERDLAREPAHLFVDARATQGAVMEVSSQWARWLKARRTRLRSIHMLTGSRFVKLTADFVRRWADLGDIMQIYTDAASFDEALRQAASS